jgi:hypothetical protein
MIVKLFNVIVRGTSESGLETPSRKRNSFIKSPNSIRKATLNPTEKSIVSDPSSSFNFSNLIMMKPGTNVKNINPVICLAIGMSKITVMNITNCKNSTAIRNVGFF